MSANGESSTSRMMLPTSLAVVMMSHLYTFTRCSPSSFGAWNFFSNSSTISSFRIAFYGMTLVSALLARSTSNASDAALIAGGCGTGSATDANRADLFVGARSLTLP
jgi:hypothetical protein